jgi:PleD family two-component response regulator
MTDTEFLLDTSHVLVVGSTAWLDPFVEALETRTGASIHAVRTAASALEAVDSDPVDCLVTGYALEETTGVELTRRLRESTRTLPVVLGTADGSEAVASEAIAAGVTDYVAVSDPYDQATDELVERTDRALCKAKRTVTRRERARQFDAVFQDTQTATWILDEEGCRESATHTKREASGREARTDRSARPRRHR